MGKMSELMIEKMNEEFYTDDKGVIHSTDKSNLGNPDNFNCKCGSELHLYHLYRILHSFFQYLTRSFYPFYNYIYMLYF